MNFESLKRFKPPFPLKVVERDLSKIGEVRRKVDFDEEDLRIDFSNERLLKGEIVIPVFKDKYVRPLFLKGKLLRYEMTHLGGGFYQFRILKGKFTPKLKDRRYADEEIDRKNGGEMLFWIAFDHEQQRYKLILSPDEFQKRFKAFEQTVLQPEVLQLFADFELFISSFWTTTYKKTHRFLGETKQEPKTIQNYANVLLDLQRALPMLKTYHDLLNIFGEINDTTYQLNVNEFNKQEKEINHMLEIITTQMELTYTIDDLRGEIYSKFEPIEKYISNLETKFYTRGYFIDPEKQEAFPNFLQIHYQKQLADPNGFENEETLQLQKQKCLETGITAAKISGKVQFVANK